jgi:hypothetical protein
MANVAVFQTFGGTALLSGWLGADLEGEEASAGGMAEEVEQLLDQQDGVA